MHDNATHVLRFGTLTAGVALLAGLLVATPGCGGGSGGAISAGTTGTASFQPELITTATSAAVGTAHIHALEEFQPLFRLSSGYDASGRLAPLSGLTDVAGSLKKEGSMEMSTFSVSEVGSSGIYVAPEMEVHDPGDYHGTVAFTTGGRLYSHSWEFSAGTPHAVSSQGTYRVEIGVEPEGTSGLEVSCTALTASDRAPVPGLSGARIRVQDPSALVLDLNLAATEAPGGLYSASASGLETGTYDITFDPDGTGADMASFRLRFPL